MGARIMYSKFYALGHVLKDPIYKKSEKGNPFTYFILECKNPDTKKNVWLRVICFDDLALQCMSLKSGDFIWVEGNFGAMPRARVHRVAFVVTNVIPIEIQGEFKKVTRKKLKEMEESGAGTDINEEKEEEINDIPF